MKVASMECELVAKSAFVVAALLDEIMVAYSVEKLATLLDGMLAR